MNTQAITRQEMVDAMQAQFNARIQEPLGRNWCRINTITAQQGDVATPVTTFDFHLLELYTNGKLDGHTKGEMERGDHSNGALLPNMLCYIQPDRAFSQSYEGFASLQQIYIDDAIFREVAIGVGPGDPDNLKPLGFQGAFEPKLKRLAEMILDEARAGAPGGELYADLLAQQIALLILRRRLDGSEKRPEVRPLSDAEIARVTEFMEANLEEVGGMNALASVIGMDVFSFTRAFKAKTGEAPHQYLIGRRLTRVKDMLRHTTDSIAEIAYAAGFSSQSHMTATFSNRFGKPPGAYRKAIKS